jgi:hypothetical protein
MRSSYNYKDPILHYSGQRWHWRVGPFHVPEAEARPESDGARARAFFKAKGWQLGPDVAMERLVWIVDLRPERADDHLHGGPGGPRADAADLRVGGKAYDRWGAFASAFQQRGPGKLHGED